MIKGIHHAALSVLDLDRAVRYFTKGAGLVVERRWRLSAPDDGGDAVLLRGPNGFVELQWHSGPDRGAPAARPVSAAGITHLCFQHQSIEELFAGFTQAGAAPHAAPVALGTGYHYCYVRDAETNVLELEGNPVAPPPRGPWLSHVSLSTPDVDRLAGFYAGLLGRGIRSAGQFGPNPLIDRITRLDGTRVRVAWLDACNIGLEIMQYLNPPTLAERHERKVSAPGYSLVCFEVDDLASELKRLEGLGVRLLGPAICGEDGMIAFGRDPDGNLLKFVEFTATSRSRSLDTLSDPAALHRADAAMAESRAQPQESTSA
jgi:catechol 2,3-dioxygenase-like lactoylglutathione lyase family enzyme